MSILNFAPRNCSTLSRSTYSIEIFTRELLFEVIEDCLSECVVLLSGEDLVDETTLV